jgi:glycosyltransferase involved in cell wall biosynthesis/2-polyprenyl-3-methyl-5-hydroxy-6-metoxy-1,4-benzoquinol methylase
MHDTPLKILYLTDTADIIGGGEISLLNLLEHLDRVHFFPLVAVPGTGSFTSKLEALGVSVVRLPIKKMKNPFNIFSTLGALKKLLTLIDQQGIKLIHSNSTGGVALLGGIAARRRKIPFVWHVRTIGPGGILDLLQAFLATKIVVISKYVTRRFRGLAVGDKLTVIYNGVNVEKFSSAVHSLELRQELGCSDADFLLGAVGRYHPIKHYENFIEVARSVAREMPAVKFVIVGFDYRDDNRYLTYLRKLVRRNNLEKKFFFLGGRDAIAAVMQGLDALVLTSPDEPFGRVLIEAMACAKPVIAFKSGGPVEIVQDGATGFLVEPGDIRAMAEKIVHLAKDKPRASALGRNGLARARELFDIKHHARQIEALYAVLLEAPACQVRPCNLCAGNETKILEREGVHEVVRCQGCGLIYVDPIPESQSLFNHYDQAYYEPWLSSQAQARQRIWKERLHKLTRLKGSKGRLLDVGSGCGFFMHEARQAGWEVYGTEVSDYAIVYAKQAFGLEIVKGELATANFPDAFFDAITLWHVLEHTSDPLKNLRASVRLLKPGGVLIVAVPNARAWVYELAYRCLKFKRPKMFSLSYREIHLYFFSCGVLRKMMEQAGLRSVQCGIDTGRAMFKERLLDNAAWVVHKIFLVNIGMGLEAYGSKS